MPAPNVDWNAGHVETLRSMWGDGFSASQIAQLIPGATRSAVCGKAHRMRLSSKLRQAPAEVKTRSKKQAAKDIGLVNRMNHRRYVLPLLPEAVPGDMSRLVGATWKAIPGSPPVSMMALEPGMCKWPIGDGRSFLFCGHASSDRPYCAHHERLSTGNGSSMERAAIKFAVDANKAEWREGEAARMRKWNRPAQEPA